MLRFSWQPRRRSSSIVAAIHEGLKEFIDVANESRSWVDRLLRRSGNPIPPEVDPCDDPSTRSEVHCGDVVAHASDYMDGDVSASLSDKIKYHLGLCQDCNGWVKTFVATVGLARELPQKEVPDSLQQKLRDISRGSS